MLKNVYWVIGLLILSGIVGERTLSGADAETWDGTIVQYGKMHEAIGQQQHQGRVQLKKLLLRPHFYGVAALEKLEGEATILDGQITITHVDAKGQLEPTMSAQPDASAALLVGAYIPSWTKHTVTRNVTPDEIDRYIEDACEALITPSRPFIFTNEGEFSSVRVHVINGACPLHARLKKIELPKETQAFEAEFEKVRGTIVGVFAKDAVGNITHPATSTHMHLVFKDDQTGKMVTGHVEKIGLLKGATLSLPKTK